MSKVKWAEGECWLETQDWKIGEYKVIEVNVILVGINSVLVYGIMMTTRDKPVPLQDQD